MGTHGSLGAAAAFVGWELAVGVDLSLEALEELLTGGTGARWRAETVAGQMVRFQEILRKLAIIDEGLVEDQAGLGLGLAGPAALDAETAALVRVGVLAAIGAPAVGLEWGTTRALAAGW